jgi:hypothetical protein
MQTGGQGFKVVFPVFVITNVIVMLCTTTLFVSIGKPFSPPLPFPPLSYVGFWCITAS